MSVAWKLSGVEAVLGAAARGGRADMPVTGVSTDSRTVRPGDLFVALAGERFDGYEFVAAAAAAGAVAAVVSRAGTAALPEIVVPDTGAALRALARARRREFPGPVVAVTGSCGKTTTKDFIGAVLERRYRVRATAANFNNEVGVPLSILALEEGDEALVLELGVSAPGEMAPLAAAAEPTVAVITGVAPTHLEFFGDVAAVRREKATLLNYVRPGGAAVLNADDALVASLVYELRDGLRCITYGLTPTADVYAAGAPTLALAGSRFTLAGGPEVTLQVPGEYNVSNALAAVAVGRFLGVPDADAAAALASYGGRPLRSNVVTTAGGVTFFVDCYNASPYAVEAALAFIAGVPAAGRRIAVLGDMLELGAASDAAHRAAGKLAAEKGYGVLVGLGRGGAAVVAGAAAAGMPPARARAFESYDAAAAFLRETLAAGDVVVVKASRAMKLEELLARLGVAGGE